MLAMRSSHSLSLFGFTESIKFFLRLLGGEGVVVVVVVVVVVCGVVLRSFHLVRSHLFHQLDLAVVEEVGGSGVVEEGGSVYTGFICVDSKR